MGNDNTSITRRDFVKQTAAAATAAMIVPRHVLGRGYQAPSDLVNIATVGVSGMGAVNTRAVMSQNIVALCDVDFDLLDSRLEAWSRPPRPPQPRPAGPPPPPSPWKDYGPSKAQLAADARWPAIDQDATLRRFVEQQIPRVKKYRDYREMLEKQKDIDAIIVATPDHMHAVIASNAMSLGKHVYVQKPLCWSVHEARHLAKKAIDTKVVTQMGNQRHSADNSRRGIEYIQSGALGDIREVHVWTNRPLGFWPQGVPGRHRSAVIPRNCVGTTAASCSASAPRCSGQTAVTRCPTSCRGICSLVSRRTSITTRSIIHSTGAAGSTGVRARSATWART